MSPSASATVAKSHMPRSGPARAPGFLGSFPLGLATSLSCRDACHHAWPARVLRPGIAAGPGRVSRWGRALEPDRRTVAFPVIGALGSKEGSRRVERRLSSRRTTR